MITSTRHIPYCVYADLKCILSPDLISSEELRKLQQVLNQKLPHTSPVVFSSESESILFYKNHVIKKLTEKLSPISLKRISLAFDTLPHPSVDRIQRLYTQSTSDRYHFIAYPRKLWPLPSDHLPIKYTAILPKLKLSDSYPRVPLALMSWNTNGNDQADRWFNPQSKEFPLYYRLRPLPSTYQGLDGSAATLPFEERKWYVLNTIKQILEHSNPDIFVLQELSSELHEHLQKIDGYQLVAKENLATLYNQGTVFVTMHKTPFAFLQHLECNQIIASKRHTQTKPLHLFNVHLPGASREIIETADRRSLMEYATQIHSTTTLPVICIGDMNAIPEVALDSITPPAWSISAPLYPTNIDPYGENPHLITDGPRLAKTIDMLISTPGSIVTVATSSQLPYCVQHALLILQACLTAYTDGLRKRSNEQCASPASHCSRDCS